MGWKMLALAIFSMGHVRTYLCVTRSEAIRMLTPRSFSRAMADQPTWSALDSPLIDLLSWVIFAVGGILVLGSYYRLGIKHTYLGASWADSVVACLTMRARDSRLLWLPDGRARDRLPLQHPRQSDVLGLHARVPVDGAWVTRASP